MPTPQEIQAEIEKKQKELEKQRKQIEAQLMGGYSPGGIYSDDFGIPREYKPTYYTGFVAPSGMGINIKGMKDEPSMVADLVNIRVQQEKEQRKLIGMPMTGEEVKARKAAIEAEVMDQYFKKPVTQQETFDQTYEERTPATTVGQVFDVEPAPPMNLPRPSDMSTFDLYTAPFRPQSLAPQPVVERQKKEAKRKALDVDWDSVNANLAAAEGEDPYTTKPYTEGLKEAYLTVLNSEDAPESKEEIFKLAFEEIQAMKDAPRIGELDERFQKKGPWDPYAQAYERQVYGRDDGGVPDLTPAQSAFQKRHIQYMHDRNLGTILTRLKTEPVDYVSVTIDGAGDVQVLVPKDVFNMIMSQNPKTSKPLVNQRFDKVIRESGSVMGMVKDVEPRLVPEDQEYPGFGTVSLRSAQAKAENIAMFGDPNSWYLNPQMKAEVIANPEAFRYDGFFTDMSYSGAVAETNKLWALRTVISPLNMVAGVAQNYVIEPVLDVAVSGDLTAEKARVIAEETPLYADHPVLANIAAGKGFAGEMDDLADAMQMEGWSKTGMVTLGFAMDILDPTIGVMGAIGKGAKVGKELKMANTALLNAKSAKEIAAIRKGAMLDSFYDDFNGVSLINKGYRKMTGKPRTPMYNGDIRLHFADDLNEQMVITNKIRYKATIENKPVQQIKMELMSEGHNINKGVAQAWDSEVSELMPSLQNDRVAAKQAIDNLTNKPEVMGENFVNFAKQYDDVSTAFDDVARQIEASGTDEAAGMITSPRYANLDAETRTLVNDVLMAKTGQIEPVGVDLARVLTDAKATTQSILARRFMFETMPDLPAGDIVAITRNTWANPSRVDNIVAASNNTEMGKLIGQIAKQSEGSTFLRPKTNIGGGGTYRGYTTVLRDGTEVVPMTRLTETQATALKAEMNKMPMPNNLRQRILIDLDAKSIDGDPLPVIALSDLRDLKAVNIDMTAKLMPESMVSIDDLSKLSKKEQFRLLEAETQRRIGWVGDWWDAGYESVLGKQQSQTSKQVDKIAKATDTTLGQKRMFREISQESATMDIKARNIVEGLTAKGPEGMQWRRFYGLPVDRIPTRQEALGAAIVGPRTDELSFIIKDQDGSLFVVGADEFIAQDKIFQATQRQSLEQATQELQKTIDEGKAYLKLDSNAPPQPFTKQQLIDDNAAKVKDIKQKGIAQADPDFTREINQSNNKLARDTAAIKKARTQALEDAKNTGVGNPQQIVANADTQLEATRTAARLERDAIRRKYLAQRDAALAEQKAQHEIKMTLWDDAMKAQKDKLKAMNDALEGKTPRLEDLGRGYIGKKPVYEWNEGIGENVIVGVRQGDLSASNQLARMEDTIGWFMNRLYYQQTKKPSWIDRFSGNQYFYNTQFLNAKGQMAADEIVRGISLRAMEDPANLWKFIEEGSMEYRRLINDPTNIKITVNPRDVRSAIEATFDEAGNISNYDLESLRKVQAQLTVGMYYYAEGSRIVDRNLIRAIDDGVLNNADFMNLNSVEQQSMMRSVGWTPAKPKPDLTPEELAQFNDLQKQRTQLAAQLSRENYPLQVRAYVTKSLNRQEPSASTIAQDLVGLQAQLKQMGLTSQNVGVIGTPYESLYFVRGLNDELIPRQISEAQFQAEQAGLQRELNILADKQRSDLPLTFEEQQRFDTLIEGVFAQNDLMAGGARIKATGDIILKQNGMSIRPNLSASEISDVVDGLLGIGNEKVGEAILGKDTYKALKQQVYNNRKTGIQNQIDEVLRQEMLTDRWVTTASKWSNGLGSLFYSMVLAGRVKFYMNNYLTGAPIVYTQTDQAAAPLMAQAFGNALPMSDKGMMKAGVPNIAMNRTIAYTNPSQPSYYQIAYVDDYGRPYTFGELNEVIMRGGSRSEFSFINSTVRDEMIAYIRENQGLTQSSLDWLQNTMTKGSDLTTREDYIWRSGALLDQLKKGRSLEEAQNTARRSMYDYNDMTPFEKQMAANILVFYSFNRQNLVGFLRSMRSAENFKKYLNILKFDRGMEMVAEQAQISIEGENGKWNPNIFMPDYINNRTILYKEDVADKPNMSYYFGSPAVPAIDAIVLGASMVQRPVSTLQTELQNMTNPQVKFLLGVSSTFQKTPPKRVPDNVVRVIDYWDWDTDPNKIADNLSMIVGSKVTPIPSENAYSGYIYPLTEAQAKRYADVMKITDALGAGFMAPAQEWAQIFDLGVFGGTEGSKLETTNLLEFLTTTPFRVMTPEQQEVYNLYLRKKALEEQLSLEGKALKEVREERKKAQKEGTIPQP